MTTNIDYEKTNFVYSDLTNIQGQPTYDLLKKIKEELTSNAASVPSDLGGGGHGHSGLVLTAAEHALLSPVPYVRPAHPRPLVIPAGPPAEPAYMRQEMRETHKEQLRVFRECDNVDKCLKKQLNRAIPDLYLKRFKNRLTNTITTPIPTILQYLFSTYGKITSDKVTAVESALRTKVFDITQPMEVMYNEVEDLQELATAGSMPFSDPQLVSLGIQLLKNMHDFETGLTSWYARLPATNTWPNFKLHFEDAYQALRNVRGETMRNTIFQQQANAMTAHMLDEIKKDNAEVREEIRASEEKIFSMFESHTPSSAPTHPPIPPAPAANSAVDNKVQLEILKQLKELKEMSTSKKKPRNSNKNNGGKDNASSENDSDDTSGKKKKKKYRFNTSKYCWTHGAWNHHSADCKNKAEGHQDQATFKNMMGGCTDFCQVCN